MYLCPPIYSEFYLNLGLGSEKTIMDDILASHHDMLLSTLCLGSKKTVMDYITFVYDMSLSIGI